MQISKQFVFLHTKRYDDMNSVFAQRLLNARKIRCMSQRELSASTKGKVSPTAIAKYEKGLMMPSSAVLIILCKALEMKLDYFFRPFTVDIDSSKFEFRKSSSLGRKKVDSLKSMVCSEIEKYIEIENILQMNPHSALDYKKDIVENEKDAMRVALQLRKDLDIGLDAIVSAIELLESVGVKIIEIDHDGKFSGTCNVAGGIPVIVINRNMTSERKRITIFHELGHLLMHCAEGVDEEKMCTIFANEVLIPSARFKELIGEQRHDISLIELQSIQRIYGISVDALMAKAAQLNIITDKRYATFHKKKNALPAFKKAVEEGCYPMEETKRFKRLVYRALASELVSISKAAALLDTSVEDVRTSLNLM